MHDTRDSTPRSATSRPFHQQVGFVGPPNYFDASPSDFLRLAPDTVGVQGRPVTRADERGITDAARVLAGSGADLVAVVGSNWSATGLESCRAMRAFRDRIALACARPVLIAPLSIAEALRRLGVGRIALNALYSTSQWRQRLGAFFTASGFSVAYAGSLVDQGLVSDPLSLAAREGVFPRAMVDASIDHVLTVAGDVDAMVMTGIPGFHDDEAGPIRRMVHLTATLEDAFGVPIVSTDTALYHGIAVELGLPRLMPDMRMTPGH